MKRDCSTFVLLPQKTSQNTISLPANTCTCQAHFMCVIKKRIKYVSFIAIAIKKIVLGLIYVRFRIRYQQQLI